MKVSSELHRIHCVLTYIKERHYPNKVEIMDYLTDKDLVVSERTIERDLQFIRTDLKIEVDYNRRERGYKLRDEMSSNQSLIDLLELMISNEVLMGYHNDLAETSKHIVMAHYPMQNIHFLSTLLQGIKDRKKVAFRYHTFYGKKFPISAEPYFVRWYQQRWYLYVRDEKVKSKSFALDRMLDVQITDESFVLDEDVLEEMKAFVNSRVGLFSGEGIIEKVILEAEEDQIKYLESLPLHSSQKMLTDWKGRKGNFVQLEVEPNFELEQEILKLSHSVTVLAPDALRNRIKNLLEERLKTYQ